MKILVVEENKRLGDIIFQTLAAKTLGIKGNEVHGFENYNAAYKHYCNNKPFDLIFIGNKIDNESSVKLLKRFRDQSDGEDMNNIYIISDNFSMVNEKAKEILGEELDRKKVISRSFIDYKLEKLVEKYQEKHQS